MTDFFYSFHFIRPYWLLLLLPSLFAVWLYAKQNRAINKWSDYIDHDLLDVLTGTQQQDGKHVQQRRTQLILMAVCFMLSSLILAGPSYRKTPQPADKQAEHYIILLDMSLSMSATDVLPDRITRAKFKIHEILETYRGSRFSLIGYAQNAYVLAPLTQDIEAISNVLQGIHTQTAPDQGSNALAAMQLAQDLITRNRLGQSQIILLTDGIDHQSIPAIAGIQKSLATAHFGIIAIGTQTGAPIKWQHGLLRNTRGDLIISTLQWESLQQLAYASQGKLALLTADNQDIEAIAKPQRSWRVHPVSSDKNQQAKALEQKFDQWQDEGIWLLWLLLPLVLMLFRRGWLLLCLFLFSTIYQQPAIAWSWDDGWKLWQQKRGERALEQQDYIQAQALLTHPVDQGIAAYFHGDQERALHYLKQQDTAVSNYNLGMIYLKEHHYLQAAEALQRTLQQVRPEQVQLTQDARNKLNQIQQQLVQQQLAQPQDKTSSENAASQQNAEQKSKQHAPANTQQGLQQEKSVRNRSHNTNEHQADAGNNDAAGRNQDSRTKHQQKSVAQNPSSAQQIADRTPSQKASQKTPAEQTITSERSQAAHSDPQTTNIAVPKDTSMPDKQNKESSQSHSMVHHAPKLSENNQAEENQEDSLSVMPPPVKKIPKRQAYQQRTQEQRQMEQWLRNIPDHPGALIKRKLLLEQQKKYRDSTKLPTTAEKML